MLVVGEPFFDMFHRYINPLAGSVVSDLRDSFARVKDEAKIDEMNIGGYRIGTETHPMRKFTTGSLSIRL